MTRLTESTAIVLPYLLLALASSTFAMMVRVLPQAACSAGAVQALCQLLPAPEQ